MSCQTPCVGHKFSELWQVFDLVPHIWDGEFRPLWNFHRRDLVIPVDMFVSSQDLVQEADRAFTLIGKEDVLVGNESLEISRNKIGLTALLTMNQCRAFLHRNFYLSRRDIYSSASKT